MTLKFLKTNQRKQKKEKSLTRSKLRSLKSMIRSRNLRRPNQAKTLPVLRKQQILSSIQEKLRLQSRLMMKSKEWKPFYTVMEKILKVFIVN